MVNPLGIFIIAEDPLVRGSLARALASEPGLTVVGTSPGPQPALTDLETYRPDVILWDIGWSAVSWQPIDELPDPEIPILVLAPKRMISEVPLEPGIKGIVDRESPPEQLMSAISAAASGLWVFDHSPSRAFPAGTPRVGGPDAVETLTARELQVLQLLAEGLPNKSIALRLGISDHTVKFHINAIMSKLAAQSRTEAVVLATRLGWLHL